MAYHTVEIPTPGDQEEGTCITNTCGLLGRVTEPQETRTKQGIIAAVRPLAEVNLSHSDKVVTDNEIK